MSYSPKTWNLEDPITPTDMNRIETGIAAVSTHIAPTGVVLEYISGVAPTGWLLCDGEPVSRQTYSDLFALIGTSYGAGDGATTFNLPDLRGRVPVGFDSTQSDFNELGKTGGAKTHSLTAAQLASHNHSISHTHSSYRYRSSGGGPTVEWASGMSQTNSYAVTHTTSGSSAANSGSTGSGSAHNNLQPYVTMNYIIKT